MFKKKIKELFKNERFFKYKRIFKNKIKIDLKKLKNKSEQKSNNGNQSDGRLRNNIIDDCSASATMSVMIIAHMHYDCSTHVL